MDRDRVLETFTADRPRLVRLATRILADPAEAEDIVQQAWLRLDRADTPTIDSPGAWLTTVVTRLCLDRLKARVPVPVADDTGDGRPAVSADDPADDVVLADSVGAALHVVVDRLSPTERVAFVLHDSFGVEFATIAEILDCTPAAARKLASRARARVGGGRGPGADTTDGSEGSADAAVVDAFLAAARHGAAGARRRSSGRRVVRPRYRPGGVRLPGRGRGRDPDRFPGGGARPTWRAPTSTHRPGHIRGAGVVRGVGRADSPRPRPERDDSS